MAITFTFVLASLAQNSPDASQLRPSHKITVWWITSLITNYLFVGLYTYNPVSRDIEQLKNHFVYKVKEKKSWRSERRWENSFETLIMIHLHYKYHYDYRSIIILLFLICCLHVWLNEVLTSPAEASQNNVMTKLRSRS
jgi:hypothetical protein